MKTTTRYSPALTTDNVTYFRFTGPQRLSKAIHELEGVLLGVTADVRVNDSELRRLGQWLNDHQDFRDRHPFSEVISMLSTVIADGIVDEQERADLLWMCGQFSEDADYYRDTTSDLQRLQGLMVGIAGDGKINPQELAALQAWMDNHQTLKSCWPYDELESLLLQVLKDGVISSDEHSALMRYFSEFTSTKNHRAIELKDELAAYTVTGVCAVDPEITFEDKTFCFTGKSKKCPRSTLAEMVRSRGAVFTDTVTRETNYLIVGADGNPCWAFSCYGRKVEQAIKLRRDGLRLVIVHEVDFWDCFH